MGLSTFDRFKTLRTVDAHALTSDELAALQRTMLVMFDDVLAVCAAEGLPYALGGGSALGAVRHRGFIPWDDDLDVNMPRAAWPRLRDALRARFGDKYVVYEPGCPADYPLAFPRIRLRGTRCVTREDLLAPHVEPGVFIDIFLFENVPDNGLLRSVHGFGSLALGFLYSCRKQFFERTFLRRWGLNGSAFRLKRFIGCFLAVLPLGVWTRLWDGWNGLSRKTSSRLVTCPVGRRHYFGELAPRTEMVGFREIEFEGRTVHVPIGLEAYLTRLYGPNYLTPPPPERRERHVVFEPLKLKTAEHPPQMDRDEAEKEQ